MSERYLYGPVRPESGEDAEWNLPAALATKHALTVAADSLLPEVSEEGGDKRDYLFNDREIVAISRTSMFGAVTWSLDFGPMPHFSHRLIEHTSGGFLVDKNRTASYIDRMATRYELTKKSEDDIDFYKTDWVAKTPDDEPLEVSQGEAKAILEELAEFEGAEEV